MSAKLRRAIYGLVTTSVAVAAWLAYLSARPLVSFGVIVAVPTSILIGLGSAIAFVWTSWFRFAHCQQGSGDYPRLTKRIWRWWTIFVICLYIDLSFLLAWDVIDIAIDEPPVPPESHEFFWTYWVPFYAQATALAALVFFPSLVHWIRRSDEPPSERPT